MYSHISNAVLPYYYSVILYNCVFTLMVVDIDHVRMCNQLELEAAYHVLPLGADHLIPGGLWFFCEKKDCSANF